MDPFKGTLIIPLKIKPGDDTMEEFQVRLVVLGVGTQARQAESCRFGMSDLRTIRVY